MFVLAVAFILTVLIFYINSTNDILGRFHRDVYLYLIEALAFNGYYFDTYSYINILSPLIPFLTSLMYRLGFVTEVSIFFVTSVFFFFSIVGMYYILKLRFEDVWCVLGVALYCSFTIIMKWAGNGTIDIPSVCLWIWGMYFFIKAMDNQKFFYLSIPLFVLSVFAKYVTIMTIPLPIIYLLSRGSVVETFKKYGNNFFGGILVSLLCIVPFAYFYITHDVFRNIASYAKPVYSTGSSVHEVNDFLFYALNLDKIIFRYGVIGFVDLFFMLVGVVCGLYCLYRILKFYYNDDFSLKSLWDRLSYFVVVLSIVGIVASFLFSKDFSTTFCVPLFYVSICLFTLSFNRVLVRYNEKVDVKYESFSYDLMMFVWFMSHFVFLSAFLVKTYRYGIAFVPPVVFFIVCGFKRIYGWIGEGFAFKKYLPYVFILCFLVVSFGHLTVDGHDDWVGDERLTVDWLKANVDLDSVNIWSDRPVYAWYLEKDFHYIDNRGDVGNLSLDMIDAGVDYYISHEPKLVIPNYTVCKVIGSVTIFKRV